MDEQNTEARPGNVTSVRFDADQLKRDLTSVIEGGIQNLVEGAQADVRALAAQIALDTSLVLTYPPQERDRRLRQLRAEVGMAAEKQRIRAVNEGWETVQKTVEIAQQALITGLLAAL